MVNTITPNEYCGLVFDKEVDQIPISLAREVARVGSMSLWEYQYFVHHDHPCFEPDEVYVEIEQAESWAKTLSKKFPKFKFVISINPLDRMSWYQALSDAPTEDEPEWEDFSPPVKLDFGAMKQMMETAKKSPDLVEGFREANASLFARMTPRKGSVGSCEKCGQSAGFSEPFVDEKHRGIRRFHCLGCDALLVHSTREIRIKVGFRS